LAARALEADLQRVHPGLKLEVTLQRESTDILLTLRRLKELDHAA
jgi:hypothetical protein